MSTVVTSENSAEFYANKLGLAAEATEPEPVVEEAGEVPEPEVESEPEAEKPVVEQEKKPNPKLEKRFSELTKQRELARQEAERERQAKVELEAKVKELEGKINPAPVVGDDVEPKPEQFRDAYEYAKALAEFSAEKALKERDKQEAERKAQEQRQKILETWAERQTATKAELPDYEEMIASSDVSVSDQVRDAILESEVGPRILYHLAENPEVAQAINALTVQSALKMIGRLEAKFEKAPEEAPKPVATKSKAPAPISPIRGSGAVPDVSDADKMDYQQWKAMRKSGKIR
jgi:chromosome segregation ATPase